MDWKVLLAICLFLAFLGWDMVRAYKRGDFLIQDKTLVLSGLTVQLLGYFDTQNINVFGQNQEQELQMLFNKQLSTDISRLILCVFLGYVLPDVAFAQSGGRWTNIAALVVSFSFHMATEVYALQNVNNPSIRNEGGGLFISSTVLLSVGIICLVLYLGCAVLQGKFSRDDLVYKIPQLFPQNEGDGGKMIKDEIFDAWVAVRGCLEQNRLYSSVYAPGVAMIVTICIAVVAAKVGCQKFVLHSNVGLSFYLRCAFILIGWIVIVWRCILDLLFCYIDSDTDVELEVIPIGNCITHCRRLIYLYIQIASDRMPRGSASIFIFAIKLAFCLFCGVFILLSLITVISAILPAILAKILRILAKKLKFIDFKKKVVGRQVFMMSASSCNETEDSMRKACKIGQECEELLAVIERSVAENREIIVNKIQPRPNWKMAAVAAISVIVELADGCNLDEEVQVAIKAFKQAKIFLEVVDCPDNIVVDPINLFNTCRLQAYRLNLEAQYEMLKLENLLTNGKQRRPVSTFEEVAAFVGRLGGKEEFAKSQGSLGPPISSYEYTPETSGSIKCVCEIISQGCYSTKEELMNVAVNCLGDIIGACVLLLPDVLLQQRRHWVREFQEDKCRKAVEIAAKLSGVREKWSPAERKTNKCEDIEAGQKECPQSEITEE